MANIVGSLSEKNPSFLFSEIKTFKSVFPNSYFFAVDSLESEEPQNIIMVGYNVENSRDLLSVNTGEPFLSDIASKQIDLSKYDFSELPLFTDNYAPVEYFISQRLTQE